MSVTTKQAEVTCHACTRSTKVAYKDPGELVEHLESRGWDTAHGAISCPAHCGIRLMPRHQFGLVAQGAGHERRAQS